ncbi:MAG: hypothetical protein ACE5JO_05705 [Candidatus Binatia bacterium]
MESLPPMEKEIDAILSAHGTPPRVLRKDGLPFSSGEQKLLILRSENYTIECPGLDRLNKLLAKLDSEKAKGLFWEALRKRVRHPSVPWFFISQGKILHLLEWILDELEREPLDERLIVMATEALKVEHIRYSVEELEEIGNLIGTLMAQAQFSEGERSLSARQTDETDLAPNYMQTMRAKRNIYKALGTLREVTRGALYQRLEGMLSDI